MKTKSKCIGCQGIKLVNGLGLCKRCNRHAHDFISTIEMARIKREREAMLAAVRMSKKAKKAEADAAKEKAESEGAEEGGEAGEEGEKEAGGKDSDAGSGGGK